MRLLFRNGACMQACRCLIVQVMELRCIKQMRKGLDCSAFTNFFANFFQHLYIPQATWSSSAILSP